MDQPFYYGNKAQFPVGKDRDGRIITGFYAGRTHRIIDNRRCYLGLPVNEDILNRVISYMEECSVEPYDGGDRHRNRASRANTQRIFSGEVMVCLVVNAKSCHRVKKNWWERLRAITGMASITISINRKKTNVIMGGDIRLIWGKTYITDSIGDISIGYHRFPLSG